VHVLIAQVRPAPVLTHPDEPEHRILIAGEPYGIQVRAQTVLPKQAD
jgi:hypothetical protein